MTGTNVSNLSSPLSSPSSKVSSGVASKILEDALHQMDDVINLNSSRSFNSPDDVSPISSLSVKFDSERRWMNTDDPKTEKNDTIGNEGDVAKALENLKNAMVSSKKESFHDFAMMKSNFRFCHMWLKNNTMTYDEKGDVTNQPLRDENARLTTYLEVVEKQLENLRLSLSDMKTLLDSKNQLLFQTELALDRALAKSCKLPNSEVVCPTCHEKIDMSEYNAEFPSSPTLPPKSPKFHQNNLILNHDQSTLNTSLIKQQQLNEKQTQIKSPLSRSTSFRKLISRISLRGKENKNHLEDVDIPTANDHVTSCIMKTTFESEGDDKKKNDVQPNMRNESPQLIANSVIRIPDWNCEQVCSWFQLLGLDAYVHRVRMQCLTGKDIISLIRSDNESCMNNVSSKLHMKNGIHKKKLCLSIENELLSKGSGRCRGANKRGRLRSSLSLLDHSWVANTWLPHLGLSQYRDVFLQHAVDVSTLCQLTVSEIVTELQVSNAIHASSLKWSLHLLRLHDFDPSILVRTKNDEGQVDSANNSTSACVHKEREDSSCVVAHWTNCRVVEWLTEIDLAEYSSSISEISGVNGALLLYECEMNASLLCDLVGLSKEKSLLRRHLSVKFNELLGEDCVKDKKIKCDVKRNKNENENTEGVLQRLTINSKYVGTVVEKCRNHHQGSSPSGRFTPSLRRRRKSSTKCKNIQLSDSKCPLDQLFYSHIQK